MNPSSTKRIKVDCGETEFDSCLKLVQNWLNHHQLNGRQISVVGSGAVRLYLESGITTSVNPVNTNDLDIAFPNTHKTDFDDLVKSFYDYAYDRISAVKGERTAGKPNWFYGCKSIVDFRIKLKDCMDDASFQVSFIHYPIYDYDIMDVIKEFDFDFVQVAFDLQHRSYVFGSEQTKLALSSGVGRVTRCFPFGDEITVEEVKKLESTLNRMLKYQKRGFRFSNKPVMEFIDVVEKKSDVVDQNSTEPDSIKSEARREDVFEQLMHEGLYNA